MLQGPLGQVKVTDAACPQMIIVQTLLGIMVCGDLAWWWKANRLLRSPGMRLLRIFVGAFMAMQIAGLGMSILLDRTGSEAAAHWMPKPFQVAVYLWHIMVLPSLLAAWVAIAFCRAIRQVAVRIRARSMSSQKAGIEPDKDPGGTRREFLFAAAATAPSLLLLGTSAVALRQLAQFRVRRFSLSFAGLPPELDGLSIAHISDLHIGRFTHGKILEDVVRVTNDLRADLVLQTGDLINYSLDDLPVALEVMAALKAVHGVFLCEGNHDLFQNGREFRRRTIEAGLLLLVNQCATISIHGKSVQLMGLQWTGHSNGSRGSEEDRESAICKAVQYLAGQRESDAFPILLAHHPHAFDYAEQIPLTLSGHTHGGQLMLTDRIGIGPAMFRYWSGLYQRDRRSLVVSNGIGNWFPLRMRAPAEIVHLTLRRAV